MINENLYAKKYNSDGLSFRFFFFRNKTFLFDWLLGEYNRLFGASKRSCCQPTDQFLAFQVLMQHTQITRMLIATIRFLFRNRMLPKILRNFFFSKFFTICILIDNLQKLVMRKRVRRLNGMSLPIRNPYNCKSDQNKISSQIVSE